MKKKIITGLFIAAIFCSITATAQKETKKFSFGFGLEAGIPTGNSSNDYNFAGGLTLRGSLHEGPGFVTLTAGGIGYLPKSSASSAKVGLQIPVRAGYKYIIQHHFFVMGEVGYSSFSYYYKGSDDKIHSISSSSGIGVISAGVQFSVIEIALKYGFNFNKDGGIAGIRLGFNF